MKKPEFKMPSVAGKITAIFKPKPVFNQPVQLQRRYHVTRSFYAVFLVLLVILFALISIYVTHKSSSSFSERYVNRKADRSSSDDGMRYNIGTFDLETWSCELKSVDGARMVWEDYGKQCAIEMAGRDMMIPF